MPHINNSEAKEAKVAEGGGDSIRKTLKPTIGISDLVENDSPEKKKVAMHQSDENLQSFSKMPKIDIIYERTDQTPTITQLMTDPDQQQKNFKDCFTENEKYFETSDE